MRTPGSQGARRPRPAPLHTLQTILLVAPILLFSVIAHEIAHGYAALQQGDRTALDAGRLSWNPVRHVDPFFTLLLPLIMLTGSSIFGRTVVFGGAKPVPVDPRNYRHLKRGDIIVSLAGVATNFVIAIACAVVIVLVGKLATAVEALSPTVGILQAMMGWGIILNVSLISFNLLPIPPLDGSHVMKYLLPRPLAIRYVQYGRYGLVVIMLLLLVGQRVLAAWFYPAQVAIGRILDFVAPYLVASSTQWLS
ncbi:MAG: peptidase [Gemmatimonadetes bacterium]|nr:peptidase [Gemmatimonadota bacterium]